MRLLLLAPALALGGCVFAPKIVRDASEGRVVTAAGRAPISHATVRLRTSATSEAGCSSTLLRQADALTDAQGRWQIPRLDAWRLETVLDHAPVGDCQRYDLPQHPDVPGIVTTSEFKRNAFSRGHSAQLSVNERTSHGAPRMRLISGLLISSDQLLAMHLGGIVVLSPGFSLLSLRAVAQPGMRASSVALGFRAGVGLAGDLSVRVQRRAGDPVRVGPEIGLEFYVVRVFVGVTGTTAGPQRWAAFAGAGILLTH